MLGQAERRTRRCWIRPTPGDLVEGTQEGQTSYLSGDVPVECVRLMPVSLTSTRGPGTVCTGAQREPARVEPLGPPQSQEGSQPHSPSQNQIQFTYPLCPREKTYKSTAASVAAHQREAYPGEGNSFLEKLGRLLQNTCRSNRYGVCYKHDHLHANLSRHSSGCGRTPSDTIPRHSDGLGSEPSARNPDTPSTPAAENFNQSEQSSPSILLPCGIEDVGSMLDALDGTTLARMSLSTAKAVRQEHRMLFARSLRHALCIFCQAHNALQVAPAGGPHNEALATNLERATKLLHITPALQQSSDGRCSRQGRYNEYTRGELTGLIDWLVVFAGRSRQKAREDTSEARRIRASKLAHQRGGITKAASALISPPAAPRDSRTLATLRGKHSTEDPVAIATGKAQEERHAGITSVGEQKQHPNVTCEPLNAQGQIPEMENLFEEATVKAVIKKANPQSAAGPSGLRYSHLQAALCDELVEDLAAFATLVFPAVFCPKYSGHWTRALIFPRWGKRRD